MHLDGRRIPMFTCKFIEDKVTGVEVNNWRENYLARIFVESFSKLLAGHFWTFFLFRKNLPKPFSNQINSFDWLIQAHSISHWHQMRRFLAENIFWYHSKVELGCRRWNWKFRQFFLIRIPNFCYIQVIVFYLDYLPVAAVRT